MTKISLSSPINGTFDSFLLESFGVEENGMTLSVLSALARLGLDPWAEAGRLAALPKQAAAAAITRHLALKGDLTVAIRLAGLLPESATVPPLNERIDRFHRALRRDVWLWLTLWLAVCVLFIVVTRPSQLPGGATESAVSSDSAAVPAR